MNPKISNWFWTFARFSKIILIICAVLLMLADQAKANASVMIFQPNNNSSGYSHELIDVKFKKQFVFQFTTDPIYFLILKMKNRK